MQFPNPPAQDGYYWIDIHGERDSLMIAHWSRRPRNGAGWAYHESQPFLFEEGLRGINVRSDRIVFAEPKPAEAETPAPPAPAARPPGSAAPNTGIDAIVAEVMGRAVNQEIAAIAVAVVTSEDQILSDHAANPHMRSRLLAGADLLHDAVRQAVRQEAARSTS
jgi:hypothetical protein